MKDKMTYLKQVRECAFVIAKDLCDNEDKLHRLNFEHLCELMSSVDEMSAALNDAINITANEEQV